MPVRVVDRCPNGMMNPRRRAGLSSEAFQAIRCGDQIEDGNSVRRLQCEDEPEAWAPFDPARDGDGSAGLGGRALCSRAKRVND